ncbi:MAG TPA: hypothetical protein VF388_00375 [Lacunisphaera sp.]
MIGILVSLAAAVGLTARDAAPTVLYQPSLKLIEGDQPLHASYVLSITSPANVVAGSAVTITPVVSVNAAPTGISNATALSFVSLSQSSLVFTGPAQTQNITVTVDVPLGTAAGSYAWAIATSGWAAGTLDPFASINAKVTIPQIVAPPSVTISAPTDGTVYNQLYSDLPLAVPMTFTATAPANSPIMSIDADVSGTAVTLTSTGLGTSTVQATGTISLSAAGIFTVQARATNNAGTSAATAEITLNIQAPAPTVTIVQPTASNFIYTGIPLTIPFSFNAVSVYGGITALSATLNGTPVSITPLGLNTLSATGSGSLAINAAGSYTLAVTGTTSSGTTSATKTFSVSAGQTVPPPTVSIAQPLNGAVFTRVAGSPATIIPFAFTATAGIGSTISAINGVLNGNNVIMTTTGIGSPTANGTGNFSITAPGTYTFVASATAAGQGGSQSISFTVKETPAPTPDCTINWLPPISLGKVQQGGSVLPIKFTIDCACSRCGGNRDNDDCNPSHRNGRGNDTCANEHDTSVVIFIYEIMANGSTTDPDVFTYSPQGKCSDRDSTYAIDGNHYQLNYDTSRGTHRYHIDVYRQDPISGAPQLLGTKEFTTK